jgi:cytochrome c5
MPARRIAALLLACAMLALAMFAARERGGVAPAAAQQATEPPPDGGTSGVTAAVPSRAAYATTLPDSAGRGIAERWCLLCHSAMLITQQKKDSTGWEKTLAQMEKWGVTPTPEERDTLRAYLLQNFGRPSPR